MPYRFPHAYTPKKNRKGMSSEHQGMSSSLFYMCQSLFYASSHLLTTLTDASGVMTSDIDNPASDSDGCDSLFGPDPVAQRAVPDQETVSPQCFLSPKSHCPNTRCSFPFFPLPLSAPSSPGQYKTFLEDCVQAANPWEQSACRYVACRTLHSTWLGGRSGFSRARAFLPGHFAVLLTPPLFILAL